MPRSVPPVPPELRDTVRRVRAAGLRARVRLGARRTGLVLVYHLLAERTGDPGTELVAPHAVELFRRHLRVLARTCTCVRAAEFQQAVATTRRGGRPPVAITFDDDSSSHVEHALPALAEAGVPATFYLTGTAQQGRSGTYWWQDLEALWQREGAAGAPGLARRLGVPAPAPGPRFLKDLAAAVEQLPPAEHDAARRVLHDEAGRPGDGLGDAGVEALVRAGHEVGFHTPGHYRLPLLDAARLDRELHGGRARLEELAGGPLRTIAYPHGRADPRVAEAARAAGFVLGTTTDAAAWTPGGDPMLVGRYWPSYGRAAHFEVEVAQLLAGRWGAR